MPARQQNFRADAAYVPGASGNQNVQRTLLRLLTPAKYKPANKYTTLGSNVTLRISPHSFETRRQPARRRCHWERLHHHSVWGLKESRDVELKQTNYASSQSHTL